MKKLLSILPCTHEVQPLLDNIWNEYDFHLYADNLSLKPVDENYLIIGDMDSIDNYDNIPKNKIHPIMDQTTTDSEKTLHWALENGYSSLTLLGDIRSRADHFLYNLRLLHMNYERFLELSLESHEEKIFIIDDKQIHNIPLEIGQGIALVSLFCTSHVITQGLEYNSNGLMSNLGYYNICNKATHNNVRIEVKSGAIVCMISKK